MKTLVNSSLYTFKKTFDYQSLCDPKKASEAAAGLRSVYVVSYISQTHAEPPTCAHNAALVCSHILISTHIFTKVFFPCRNTLTNEVQTHMRTENFPHRGAINLGRAD